MAAFVVAGCDGSEVLEPIDGPLNDIAGFVSLGVEPWRRPTTPSFAQPVGLRIFAFRANAPDAPALNGLAVSSHPVSTIDSNPRRSLARASRPDSWH